MTNKWKRYTSAQKFIRITLFLVFFLLPILLQFNVNNIAVWMDSHTKDYSTWVGYWGNLLGNIFGITAAVWVSTSYVEKLKNKDDDKEPEEYDVEYSGELVQYYRRLLIFLLLLKNNPMLDNTIPDIRQKYMMSEYKYFHESYRGVFAEIKVGESVRRSPILFHLADIFTSKEMKNDYTNFGHPIDESIKYLISEIEKAENELS